MTTSIKELQRIFYNIREVKYILFEVKESPYLVVSFAAYFPVKASYSYLTAFDGIPCNRLYILDDFGYEKKGCWYLCENMNFDVEYAVIDLIKKVQRDCCVASKNVITIGSSKGGWCALYYALKYDFGNVIAGAPQILLGDYLNDYPQHRSILASMAGEINMANIQFLNDLLQKQIIPNPQINLFFHYGIGDWHFDKHFRSFYDTAKSKINNIYLDVKLYTGHEQLMNFFPKFLHDTVAAIVAGKTPEMMQSPKSYIQVIEQLYTDICEKTIVSSNSDNHIMIELPLALANTQFAVYLLDDKRTVLHKMFYQKDPKFEIEGVDAKSVKAVQVFFKNSMGEIRSKIKQI